MLCSVQVQKFLEKNQREAEVTQCDRGEMGGQSQEEHVKRPPFLGEIMGEEEKRGRRERVGTMEGKTEASRVESLDTEWRKCTQPSTSFSSTTGSVAIENEEEQDGKQFMCLEIPDFLLSDAPEGNNGKQ